MRRAGLVGPIGVLAAALLSAGTASAGTKTSLTGLYGPSQSASCKAPPKHGGTLVYDRQAATESLDPMNLKNGNGDIFAVNEIYGGLVAPAADGSKSTAVVPNVASSWKVSPDGKTYTFHIRPGIKFSNGQPVTAQDVKWSLDRFGDPKVNAAMAAIAGGYKSATVVNSSTVRVQLTRPVAAFLYDISLWPAFILPEKLVQKEGAAFYKNPVGTGPFVVSSFVQGSHITFTPNKHYWQKGKPYLSKLQFNFATDSNSRILALRGGSAQIMDGVPFSEISSLEGDKSIQVQAAKVPLFIGLWLNHADKPLADIHVRKAMQYAINRTEMNKDIFHGLGEIPNSVLMGLRYDAPDSVVKPYPYSLAKAKAEMKKSAYPNGFSVKLEYPSGYDYYTQLTLLLQQELAAIGIKVTLVQEDPATNTAHWQSGSYQMVFPFASFTSDVVVPDEYADFLADWSNGLKGFETNWKDPKIQAMVLKFEAMTSESARAAYWPKIQQALMDQTPVINVMNVPFVNAHASDVCGTDIDGLGSDHLEDTWIS